MRFIREVTAIMEQVEPSRDYLNEALCIASDDSRLLPEREHVKAAIALAFAYRDEMNRREHVS